MIPPCRGLRNAMIGVCVSFTTLGLFISSAFGSDVALRAKAANVINLHLQTSHEVSDFDLEVSFDGETFRNCTVGLPRVWQLFYSISQTAGEATITVPVVGAFAGPAGRFLFREPGRKWFRWTVKYEDGSDPGVFEQEIVVLESSDADLAFIQRLADPKLCRLILGQRWYDEFMDPDVQHYPEVETRAVKVIGRLLYATRDKTPASAMGTAGPQGDMVNTAQALLDLAKEIPDSSYAPYAAYYAACCYTATSMNAVTQQMRKEDSEGRFENDTEYRRRRYGLLKADPQSARGKGAFLFAAERADEYLKPRALYQSARHSLFRGELEDVGGLLSRAELAAPGSGTVADLIQKLRSNFESNRAKFERAVAEKKAPE